MPRKKIDWKLKREALHLGERTLIVGAFSVTPDSPIDGGKFVDPDRAYLHAMELAEQGADIIEICAETLLPGPNRVTEAEELRRLVPVLKKLRGKLPVRLCVETYKAAVAEKALSLDVEIIKDPSSLIFEPALAKVVVDHDAGLILQHMRGAPETWSRMTAMKDPAGTVAADLRAAMGRAVRAGVLPKSIAVDPGLGLGKRKEQNTAILARLDLIVKLEIPVQVSVSGQDFAAQKPLPASPSTAAAAAMASALRGAHLVRVHDLPAVTPALLMADEFLRG
jgi:dihydropteroate synthase